MLDIQTPSGDNEVTKMDIEEWKKFSKIGIFLGEDTFTPVRFLHSGSGSGKIRWKYMRPFASERPLENISKFAVGNEYSLFTNDKKHPTRVQIFNMDINGKPVLNHLPPSLIRINQNLTSENNNLKAENAELRKAVFDRASKDRLMKEAIRLGGFRKEFIDAGMTGAEQYGANRFGSTPFAPGPSRFQPPRSL